MIFCLRLEEGYLCMREWVLVRGGGPDLDVAPLPGPYMLMLLGRPFPRPCQLRYVGGVLGTDITLGIADDV